MRLFASRGFAGTTVGAIEAAAGLQPRRGALYRHFPSKEALLDAAVAAYNTSAEEAADSFITTPVTDPRELATLVGGWMLSRLDTQHEITAILEREGDRLPALRDAYRHGTEAGFRAASQIVAHHLAATHPDIDADVAGVTLLGGLINFRRSTWTLGAPPLDLDDERYLAGFAALFAAVVAAPQELDQPD